MMYHKKLAGQHASNRVDGSGLNTSFWGVRGSEDLGGGLQAQFEMTSFFRSDTGMPGRNDADGFFSRSSWIGLKGNWGTLRAGRQSTLSFLSIGRYSAFGASSNFNPSFLHNYQSSATQPLMTGSGATDSAWNNALSYQSPSFSGLSGAVFYAPSESTTAGTRRGANLTLNRGAFSASATFEKIGGMSLSVAAPPAVLRMEDSKLWSLGASYDFKVVKVFAQGISTRLRNAAVHVDLDTVNVGAKVPLGAGSILVSHGQTRKSQTGQSDLKRRTTSLGYDHALSKRTDLYAIVMHDALTQASSGTGFAFGMRHRF